MYNYLYFLNMHNIRKAKGKNQNDSEVLMTKVPSIFTSSEQLVTWAVCPQASQRAALFKEGTLIHRTHPIPGTDIVTVEPWASYF